MGSISNSRIFLDFDNTLGHSLCADSEKHADELLYDYGERFFGDKFEMYGYGWHVTFKRPWADDLITFCKQLIGPDNVYILTTGMQDYIYWCNVKLKLGFDPNTKIFGREDIMRYQPHPRFTDTYNVLVDDLPYREHCGNGRKVNFLNGLPITQYVKVKPFTVWEEPLEKDVEYLEKITSSIIETLELIKTEIQ
jgi:hypothetical protein